MQFAGEVQDRRSIGQSDAVGGRNLVQADLRLGWLKAPRKVVDVANEHASSEWSEEAVTLCEEVFERAGHALRERVSVRNRFEGGVVRGGLTLTAKEDATAAVQCRLSLRLTLHRGWEIRQVEKSSRAEDGQQTGTIERKEEDATKARDAGANIRPQIELGKLGGRRKPYGLLAQSAGDDLVHPEGNYARPSRAVEGVDLQSRRQKRLDLSGRYGPVAEEKIVPALTQAPGTRG